LHESFKDTAFLDILSKHNVIAVPFGKQTIRMVTHLDFHDDHLDQVVSVLKTAF
jgi:threonine aldolase